MSAMYDARAAVRWLRRHAAEHRIDPERIGAFGSSAGGMTAVYLATVEGEGDSGSPGYSSAVRAVASLSAARYPPPANASALRAAEPAYLDLHGCADPSAPQRGCTRGHASARRPPAPPRLRGGLRGGARSGHALSIIVHHPPGRCPTTATPAARARGGAARPRAGARPSRPTGRCAPLAPSPACTPLPARVTCRGAASRRRPRPRR